MSLFGDRYKVHVNRLRDGTSTTEFARRDGTWGTPSGGSAYTGTICKVMSADQSINSSTTLTNVTDLVFAIGANETWVYRCSVFAGDALTTTGVKVGATIPAGGTMALFVSAFDDTTAGGYTQLGARTVASGVAADLGIIGPTTPQLIIDAYVSTAGTSGNVQLQFAQSTSDATNLTFKKGSFGVGFKAS